MTRRVRTAQAAGAIVLAAVLLGCGSDDKPPPKAVCGLKGELVATVLGSNDLSEGRGMGIALSTVRTDGRAFYNCDVETDSFANASVTAKIEPVPAEVVSKMEQMPVRYSYERGDAALELSSSGLGDAAVSSFDARWLCGRFSVRVSAAAKERIQEEDARALLEAAADEVGCEPY